MDFIIDRSLVLYLPLYELDGASFMSKDVYGHLCTVTGALWTPRGRDFDGVDDYITIPDSPHWISGTKDWTYSLWLKWNAFTAYQALYSHYIDGTNRVEFNYRDSGPNLRFEAKPAPGVVIEDWDWSPVVDRWYFLTITRIGTAITAFLDTVSLGVDTSNPSISDIAGSLYIGANGAGDNDFDGVIGEIWFYTRGLSILEIQHNYLATKWRYH